MGRAWTQFKQFKFLPSAAAAPVPTALSLLFFFFFFAPPSETPLFCAGTLWFYILQRYSTPTDVLIEPG